eukprot:7413100-Pyramimonas_sp.AAC.1
MTHFPVLLLLLRVCFAPSSIALAFLTLVRLALLSESERLGVGSLSVVDMVRSTGWVSAL